MDRPSHGAHTDKVSPWEYDLSFWQRSESPRLLTRVPVVPGPAVLQVLLVVVAPHFTCRVVPELACTVPSILVKARQCFKATLVIWEGMKKRFSLMRSKPVRGL